MIAYIAQLDAQMSSVDGELNEVNEQVEQIEAEIADTEEKLAQAEIEAEEQYSSMKLRIQFTRLYAKFLYKRYKAFINLVKNHLSNFHSWLVCNS